MKDDEQLPSLEESVNQALDDSVNELPVSVQRKLAQIRKEAVNGSAKSSWLGLSPSWKTATAFSVAITVTLTLIFKPITEQELVIDDIELTPFADVLQEDLEMLDDLEFVYWLAEEVGSETAKL